MRPIASVVRWTAVLLTTALVATTLPADAALFHVTAHRRDLRADVERADAQWRAAMASNDVTAMESLLSDDYLGITSSGQVLTRAQQLARMRLRHIGLTQVSSSDERVKMIGTGVAIVTSEAELEGMMDGHGVDGRYRSTRVYQRTPVGWRLTRFEATPERKGRAEENVTADPERAGARSE